MLRRDWQSLSAYEFRAKSVFGDWRANKCDGNRGGATLGFDPKLGTASGFRRDDAATMSRRRGETRSGAGI